MRFVLGPPHNLRIDFSLFATFYDTAHATRLLAVCIYLSLGSVFRAPPCKRPKPCLFASLNGRHNNAVVMGRVSIIINTNTYAMRCAVRRIEEKYPLIRNHVNTSWLYAGKIVLIIYEMLEILEIRKVQYRLKCLL